MCVCVRACVRVRFCVRCYSEVSLESLTMASVRLHQAWCHAPSFFLCAMLQWLFLHFVALFWTTVRLVENIRCSHASMVVFIEMHADSKHSWSFDTRLL